MLRKANRIWLRMFILAILAECHVACHRAFGEAADVNPGMLLGRAED